MINKYANSDYALNKKNPEAIVYRFADGSIVTVTLEAYLAENPGKTAEDFHTLKTLSDADYHGWDRADYRQTWKNLSIHGWEETEHCAGESLEEMLIDRPERESEESRQLVLAAQALDKLTDIQRRRYLMHTAKGLTTREIAAKEGTSQRTVMDSIQGAEKKIRKFLSGGKK
jgi:DNA-directed RNA polymerase specialized sigma subunit